MSGLTKKDCLDLVQFIDKLQDIYDRANVLAHPGLISFDERSTPAYNRFFTLRERLLEEARAKEN